MAAYGTIAVAIDKATTSRASVWEAAPPRGEAESSRLALRRGGAAHTEVHMARGPR